MTEFVRFAKAVYDVVDNVDALQTYFFIAVTTAGFAIYAANYGVRKIYSGFRRWQTDREMPSSDVNPTYDADKGL